MNRNYWRTTSRNAIHHVFDGVSFSVFTQEQIRKLSVAKIVTSLTLDPLGHPLPGGLYDRRLGPLTDRSDPCGTCGVNFLHCRGHFGHIDLPLPVVNPIFHQMIGTILRMSCLSCFQIQIPRHIKYCIALQIKLLKCGMITDAVEISCRISELVAVYQSLDQVPEDAFKSVKKLEKLADAALKELEGKSVLNKNTEALRNQLISDTIKNIVLKGRCIFCKKPINKIQVTRNKIIMSNRREEPRDKPILGVTKVKAFDSKFVTPDESRRYMRSLWVNESDLLRCVYSVLDGIEAEYPTDVFYCDVIPVLPPRFRPVNVIDDRISEHQQTYNYKAILQNSLLLRIIIQVVKNAGNAENLSVEAKGAYTTAYGDTPIEKLNYAWETLQNDINNLMDKPNMRNSDGIGLKQIIEKKAGIIRMNMMGRRVNYSARSVITPDPNLGVEQVGIPEAFAKQLTYPSPVNFWNVEELRKMVMNGPNVYPGAVAIEYEDGMIKRLNPNDVTQRQGIARSLLTPSEKSLDYVGVKRVLRHLCNGDVVLLNRQPTLHKPSIMAHNAKVLKGEKTIHLHYANCKAYNADFDGDEMNIHFPQNELARSEGYNIANVANQYLVPKDGTPLSGLIQDHIIAAVRLTIRGSFFQEMDYHELVFHALEYKSDRFKLLPPAIIKPVVLWSGKQILSTIIMNILPEGSDLINLTSTSKIGAKAWERAKPRQWKAGGTPFKDQKTMSEAEVIIRNGELLAGILDKNHFGATPYGLIHCVQELYGGTYAAKLLSAMSKVFSRFLQHEGFTLSVRDILVTRKADSKRRKIVKKSQKLGLKAVAAALDLPEDAPPDEIVAKIEEGTVNNPKLRNVIDRQYKQLLDGVTNDINRRCLPAGLFSKFPDNNLQLMVQSGAKGSTVNTMQISCLLGQIELEGKRPPVMINGKSMPSFPIFEFAPRAGGFIDGRFMTGIQPQEFFFHCMAGREGLIDTAVKTSRSGYLQRCLIKHLEGLGVGYDMTVRDSDKSVIQFLYGEDGMDISKVQFLNEKQLKFLADNSKAVVDKKVLKDLKDHEDRANLIEHQRKVEEWRDKFGDPLKKKRKSPFALFSEIVMEKTQNQEFDSNRIASIWRKADDDIKEKFMEPCVPCPDPTNAAYQPDHHFGSLNENLEHLMKSFEGEGDKKEKRRFENMFKMKAMNSLCAPGEPVGLLAAQSIGEPSTQMTLNTFHFAGRGDMNVTLGIPRLREILMMASKNIKTPSMEIPFLDVPDLEARAENLKRTLTKVTAADVLEKIDVTVELVHQPVRQHKYTLMFQFLPRRLYRHEYNVKPKYVLKHMTKKFFAELFVTIRKFSKLSTNLVMMEEKKTARKRNGEDDENEVNDKEEVAPNPADDSSDDELDDPDDARLRSKSEQVHDAQEPAEEEKEASDVSDTEETEEGAAATKDDEDVAEENKVVSSYNFAQKYAYDKKNHEWCELTFALPLNSKRVDMKAILKDVAEKSVLWEVPSIKRAITYTKDDRLYLRTDGINVLEMCKYHELLDINRVYCNDIHKMAQTFGIEAARRVIVKEVQDVFNVYGIKVDPRHLLLISDYMTYNGTFEPLSRKGMESSASPLQQMSFESSLTFLKQATIGGKRDSLNSPSSCLMVGTPCKTGTGSFELMTDLAQARNGVISGY